MCSCWGSVDGLIVRCASASALHGDCASELGTQQSDINVGDHDGTEASRILPNGTFKEGRTGGMLAY